MPNMYNSIVNLTEWVIPYTMPVTHAIMIVGWSSARCCAMGMENMLLNQLKVLHLSFVCIVSAL
jgi:hypothetical protein